MTLNLGMVRPGSTVLIPFHTFTSDDPTASVAIADFVLADIGIYKGTSMTERVSTTGVVLLDTDGIDIDTAVGLGGFSIDLSSNATAGFYSAGSHYYVTVGPVTIDGATVNFIAATFSIGFPDAIINTTVASATSDTQFILTDGPTEADVLIGCPILIQALASAAGVGIQIGYCTDYIVTTKEVFLAADPGGGTVTAADHISIFMPANTRAVGGTLQTPGDVPALIATAQADLDTITGAAGAIIDDSAANDTTLSDAIWDEDATPHQNQGSFGQAIGDPIADTTTIYQAVATDAAGDNIAVDIVAVKAETVLIVADTGELQTDDVPTLIATAQSDLDIITGAAGAIVDTGAATVTAISDAVWDEDATGHQTLGTFGQAIGDPVADADTIYGAVVTGAAGANISVDITAIKAETVLIVADTGELQTDDLPTLIAAVQSDTDDIQTRLPAALVGSKMDSDIGNIQAGAITAAAIATGAIDADSLATDAVNEIRDAILPKINTALNDIPFVMVLSSDHVSPATGLTVVATRSINGGTTFSATTGTVTEATDGVYHFDASAADMNGALVTFKFTSATADDTFVSIRTGG